MVADASTMEYSMTSPLPTVVDTNLCEYPSNDGSLNNISMPYFQEESLSGASVASSLDINTPEIPPISDVAMATVMPSEVVAQSHLYANQPSHIQDSMSYNINTNTSYEFNSTAHQWENSQNNNATFQTGLQHESVVDTRMWPQNPTPNSNLAQSSSSYINSQENDHATGIISMSHDETQSINMQLLSSNVRHFEFSLAK